MARQITIDRTSIGLEPLQLQSPENGLYLSNEYSPAKIQWQRYEASTSPFVNGERIIAQRKINDETIFKIHMKVPEDQVFPVLDEEGFQLLDPITLEPLTTTITKNQSYQQKFIELHQALSQTRFEYTVDINGIEYKYYAMGAAEIEPIVEEGLADAGWLSFVITIPTQPYLTNTGE
jgi:hypothetical protein